MSETLLREWIRKTPGGELSHQLAEQALAAALARARAEALEEAGAHVRDEAAKWRASGDHNTASTLVVMAEHIEARARRDAPAPIPVERVREVIREVERHERGECKDSDAQGCLSSIHVALAALDVPLDAATAAPTCPDCKAPRSAHDDLGQRWWTDEAGGHLCSGFHADVVASRGRR